MFASASRPKLTQCIAAVHALVPAMPSQIPRGPALQFHKADPPSLPQTRPPGAPSIGGLNLVAVVVVDDPGPAEDGQAVQEGTGGQQGGREHEGRPQVPAAGEQAYLIPGFARITSNQIMRGVEEGGKGWGGG